MRAKNDCKTAECDEDLNIPGQHSLNQPNSLNNTPCQKGCDPTYITWGRSVLLRSLRRASGFVLGVSCFSLITFINQLNKPSISPSSPTSTAECSGRESPTIKPTAYLNLDLVGHLTQSYYIKICGCGMSTFREASTI